MRDRLIELFICRVMQHQHRFVRRNLEDDLITECRRCRRRFLNGIPMERA